MVNNTSELDDFALPLPITQTALAIAEQFANEQPTAAKATQVWLNTIAVYAVHDYLQMMGITADLGASDSWNPVSRLCADTADLMLLDRGRLECRPVSTLADACAIPPEVWDDRIGYVVVQVDEAARQASLLGFVERASVEELPLNQLNPIEALLDHLDWLSQPVTQAQSPGLDLRKVGVNLSQWLHNQFDAGWMAIESLLAPQPSLACGFRSTALRMPIDRHADVQRAKLLHVGYEANTAIVLVMALDLVADATVNVCLEVYSVETAFLPPDLRLAVVNQGGDVLMECQAGSTDAVLPIQLEFAAGEQFSIQITLDDVITNELFIV